jgi:hypothetical protein
VNAVREVTGNHGFAAPVPTAFRDGKPHRLYAYAVSADGKSAQLQGSPKPFKLSPPSQSSTKGDASISLNGITIATAARFGGAIVSLRWNGTEFVDNRDHGREIQTAWQGNNAGECFKPTEAGSAADGSGPDTTSRLLSVTATADSITTVSHPAFWLRPRRGQSECGRDSRQRRHSVLTQPHAVQCAEPVALRRRGGVELLCACNGRRRLHKLLA